MVVIRKIYAFSRRPHRLRKTTKWRILRRTNDQTHSQLRLLIWQVQYEYDSTSGSAPTIVYLKIIDLNTSFWLFMYHAKIKWLILLNYCSDVIVCNDMCWHPWFSMSTCAIAHTLIHVSYQNGIFHTNLFGYSSACDSTCTYICISSACDSTCAYVSILSVSISTRAYLSILSTQSRPSNRHPVVTPLDESC